MPRIKRSLKPGLPSGRGCKIDKFLLLIYIINMNTTITITQQWQIYIPEKIRELLDLITPGKAKLTVKDNSLVITPQQSEVLKLAGKYKALAGKKRLELSNVRERIDYSRL